MLRSEWQTVTKETDIKVLKNRALHGGLSSSSIRSVYWRVFLGIFPVGSPTKWLNNVRESRKQYNEIKNNFTLDPRITSNVPDDNPLSLDENVQSFYEVNTLLILHTDNFYICLECLAQIFL